MVERLIESFSETVRLLPIYSPRIVLTCRCSASTRSISPSLPLLLCSTPAQSLRSTTPSESRSPRSTDDSTRSDDDESGRNEAADHGDGWILLVACG